MAIRIPGKSECVLAVNSFNDINGEKRNCVMVSAKYVCTAWPAFRIGPRGMTEPRTKGTPTIVYHFIRGARPTAQVTLLGAWQQFRCFKTFFHAVLSCLEVFAEDVLWNLLLLAFGTPTIPVVFSCKLPGLNVWLLHMESSFLLCN